MIAGNWKMNKLSGEARDFAAKLLESKVGDAQDVVICAPFTALPILSESLKGSKLLLGAQNMYFEQQGAYTGEISPAMLLDLGVNSVILGHSERREYLGETDEVIGKKLQLALAQNITPILCVGETLALRESGQAKQHVRTQVEKDLSGVAAELIARVVIAYEPIWAIGTGKTASAADAEEMCAEIRAALAGLYGLPIAETVRILYGGSVKADNIAELMLQLDIDGALVGGASLEAAGFAALIKNAGAAS
jgi:triosephosphate isomerase